jgi:hypothetical protein
MSDILFGSKTTFAPGAGETVRSNRLERARSTKTSFGGVIGISLTRARLRVKSASRSAALPDAPIVDELGGEKHRST